MKKLVIILASALMVFSASTVMAGGGHRYKHHGYSGHHKSHGYYKHRSHNSHNGAYLAGGLILGSIIASSYHNNHHHSYRPTYRVVRHSTYREPVIHRQVVYRTRVAAPTVLASSGRHLFRDLEGNCFEIHQNDEGDELKEQLPEANCHW